VLYSMSMRLFFLLFIGSVAAALVLLFVGTLGQVSPGSPVVAVGIGLAVLVVAFFAFRALARGGRSDLREDPEDVADLDVFFVCTECGTEFRVEKLGELQVPRHCGEPMRVERRAREAPRGLD
jgi:hypothetical protein